MDVGEQERQSMDSYGFVWIRMDEYGQVGIEPTPWTCVEMRSMDVSGCEWIYLLGSGPIGMKSCPSDQPFFVVASGRVECHAVCDSPE
jgi:hypothetical protein